MGKRKNGKVLKLDEINKIAAVNEDMIKNEKSYSDKIAKLTKDIVFNIGTSAQVGGDYIIEAINRKIKERSKK